MSSSPVWYNELLVCIDITGCRNVTDDGSTAVGYISKNPHLTHDCWISRVVTISPAWYNELCIDITGCRNVTDDGINSRRYDSNTGEINNQLSRSDYG
ncbi:hypothetical protein DMN91_008372 [Ooceraea biroi]|uniref:Uncharacterized protein n=1 Tax=Ooceraea biroi TaxID=2015173 RepID=A0A3L8DI26_OOCBI|nr:hypothetical protein DMN91_008372 [Ooceraea biroi]